MDSSEAAAMFSGRTAKIRFDDNVLVASTNSSCSSSLDDEASDPSPSSPGSEHSTTLGSFAEDRATPFVAADTFSSPSLKLAPKNLHVEKNVNATGNGAAAASVAAGSRRRRTTSGSNADDLLRRHNKVVYTAGRPPWYDCQGTQLREPFFIGICGGSASGKTTVAKSIIELLDVPWVTLLNMDSFYKVLTEEQHHASTASEYNFDHPSAFDFDLLTRTLRRLKEGKRVEVPVYNFTTHRRENYCKTMYGASVLILEGILTFHNKEILEMMDLKIFVDADADTRLARRLLRDITERGRDVDGVLKQCETFVKPSFDNFIAPTMQNADIIIPRGGENHVAIDLIVRHIKARLDERGNGHRALLAMGLNGKSMKGTFKPPPSLYTLKQTPQLRCMHTMMRNRNTPRDEFVFYSHRVMRLLLEHALSLMPFETDEITTPSNKIYFGKRRKVDKICGVSILRAGEAMETALREVVKDCTISKILIQTNPETLEPELYYLRLPKDIHQYHVLLLDTTVATGAAAIMGIRILLEHDVKQENIMLISLLMSEIGVSSVAYAFPDVKLITSAVDKHLSDNYHILPGIGNFGNRYFGTEIDDNDAELSAIDGSDVGGHDGDDDCNKESWVEDEIAIF